MRADRGLAIAAAALALAAVLLSGCSPHVKAPKGWLPNAEEARRDPYGGWIRLQVIPGTSGAEEVEVELEDDGSWEFAGGGRSPERVTVVEGEFLGVDADSVFVLAGNDLVRAVAYPDVVAAEVAFYDPATAELQTLALAGGLATISNGYFLVLTMPMWVIGGSGAATSHTKLAMKTLDHDGWQTLRAYARFPQGPPPGLRDLHLPMRPAPAEPAPAEK